MTATRNRKWMAVVSGMFALCLSGGALEGASGDGFERAWGPLYQYDASEQRVGILWDHGQQTPRETRARIVHWNQVMLGANALDHTPVAAGETRVFGEQLGPCRTARAFAIVQIAVFEAVNAVTPVCRSYTKLQRPHGATSVDAAIAQAAHDALAAMYPSQAFVFDAALAEDLARIPDKPAKTNGIALGQQAAASILAMRANDGSDYPDPLVGTEWPTSNDPGRWRQDPVSQVPIALGAYWSQMTPFVMESAYQFRCPPMPPMPTTDYTEAFDEAKRLGGDGVNTPTERTADQTLAGVFWGYDGVPGIGTPPRLFNQIVVQIALQRRINATDLARLLALVNTAMADAGMAAWESKYTFDFWRPVIAIREADPDTGPTGAGDGNPDTHGDVDWMPLGAQASNLTGPNFTPPFPAYPSGHATFGGAVFQVLRRFYKTDRIAFTFVSDELNGVTRDNQGNVRPLAPRSFKTLSQAEEENGQSRIYLGVHWSFDKTEGVAQGRKVGNWVFDHAFTRLPRAGR